MTFISLWVTDFNLNFKTSFDGNGNCLICGSIKRLAVSAVLTSSEALLYPATSHWFCASVCVCVRLLTRPSDGGAGISILGAGGGALTIAVLLIGRHTCVTFESMAFTDRTGESAWLETKHAYSKGGCKHADTQPCS